MCSVAMGLSSIMKTLSRAFAALCMSYMLKAQPAPSWEAQTPSKRAPDAAFPALTHPRNNLQNHQDCPWWVCTASCLQRERTVWYWEIPQAGARHKDKIMCKYVKWILKERGMTQWGGEREG